MFASSLLSFREGLEMALIIGLFLSALRRLNQAGLVKYMWLGASGALAVSFAGGSILAFLGFHLTGRAEVIFDGLTLLTAVAILTWAIFWMQQRGKRLQEHLAAQIPHTVAEGKTALFLLAFVVIGREGLELILFLIAVTINTGSLINTIGGAIIGLGAATLAGWALYTSIVRLNLRPFFLVTGVLLLLFAAGLLAHGIHELIEVGWVPPIYAPVWNLNPILNESSPAGQLLKTLFGYNGDPALSEVVAYWLYLLIVGLTSYRSIKSATNPAPTHHQAR